MFSTHRPNSSSPFRWHSVLRRLMGTLPHKPSARRTAGRPHGSSHAANLSCTVESLEQRQLLSATWGAAALDSEPSTQAEPNQPEMEMRVGTNVEGVYDWMASWMFTDAFKHSRDWQSNEMNLTQGQFEWNGSRSVSTDEHGWVTELASWTTPSGDQMQQWVTTLMFQDLGAGHYPAGIYRAEWDGDGTIAAGDLVIEGDVVRVVSEGMTADGRHFAEVEVNAAGEGIYLQLRDVNPNDPMRNFNFWMPDWQGHSFAGQRDWTPGSTESPFHPRFLESLQPFDNLRMMQLLGTHEYGDDTAFEDHTVSWEDRRLLTDARQVQLDSISSGAAIEYVVELANTLQKDIWVNMPHAATADYVSGFATYVRDYLNPNLQVTVEYSNEIWNQLPWFPAYHWMTDQLAANGLTEADRTAFAAAQIREDFDIWSQVFSGQQQRINRIVGPMPSDTAMTEELLGHLAGAFDSVALNGYYLPDYDERQLFTVNTTADDVLDTAWNSIATTLGFVREQQDVVAQFEQQLGREIPVHLYEAGPHFDGMDPTYQTAFSEASQSDRIYDLQQLMINGMYDLGIVELNDYQHTHRYADSPWGNFGSLTWQEQPIAEAEKFRSLIDTVEGRMIDLNNSRPVISDVQDALVEAGDSISFSFTVGDLETDASALLIMADSSESMRIPDENLVISGSGTDRTLTVTTVPGELGRAMVSVLVVDAQHGTALDTFYVDIVDSLNEPPQALHPVYTTAEDTAFEFDLAEAVSDDHDSIEQLEITFFPEWLGQIEVLPDGRTARFTPHPDLYGTIDFWFRATDSEGLEGWGSVTVSVDAVNDAPTANDGFYQVLEDEELWIFIGDLVDDVETDWLDLTFQFDSQQHGSVVRSAGGWNLIFTPDTNYAGTASFGYTVFDDGTPVESASGLVTVEVLPVNDAPTAQGGQLSAVAGQPLQFDLLDFASDVETAAALLSFEVWDYGDGAAVLGPDGHTVSFTPPSDFSGEYQLWYRVADEEGVERWGMIQIDVQSALAVDQVFSSPLALPL